MTYETQKRSSSRGKKDVAPVKKSTKSNRL
jgi:hypothetical protein